MLQQRPAGQKLEKCPTPPSEGLMLKNFLYITNFSYIGGTTCGFAWMYGIYQFHNKLDHKNQTFLILDEDVELAFWSSVTSETPSI